MQALGGHPLMGPTLQQYLNNPDCHFAADEADYPVHRPPCECSDCQNGWYTAEEQNIDRYNYNKEISNAEAQQVLQKYRTQAQQDREYLQQRCATFGNQILSRWRKRSRDQRGEWILYADPDLYPGRWFLPRYCYTDPDWREARRFYRTGFFCPYLDKTLLKTDPSVFLSLLYNRTNYGPEDWAAFDSKQLAVTWAMGWYDVDFNDHSVVMHGPRYGDLVPWKAEEAHRADTVGYPRGRLILEAQAFLLRFLRKLVDSILEEANMDNPTGGAKLSESINSKKSGDVAYWSQYTYQPFSAPPKFDINEALSQAKARMDATADHLWLLQTEPSYMRRYVRLIRDNQIVKGIPAGSKEAYEIIVVELRWDINVAWFWQWVHDEFSHAKAWHDRTRDSIYPGQQLPRQYDRILGAIELLLVNAMHSRLHHLEAVVPQRPGFRHLWTVTGVSASAGKATFRRKTNKDTKKVFYEDPLDWCLIQLQGEPDAPRTFERSMLFDFLDEHLAGAPAQERARIDEILFEKLSDYAAVSELLDAVRLHRPQNTYRDLYDTAREDADRRAWRDWEKIRGKQPPAVDSSTLNALFKDVIDVSPLSGRKDQEFLQRFDSTHAALQGFWKSVSTGYNRMMETNNMPPEDRPWYLDVLSAHSAREYEADVARRREQILAQMAKPGVPETSTVIAFGSGSAEPDPADKKPQTRAQKAKTKSRPAAQPASDDVHLVFVDVEAPADQDQKQGEGQAQEQRQEPKIPLKQSSFDILKAMYPASIDEAARSIDWDAFVRAMADAGFAAKNTGGSAVAFEAVDGVSEKAEAKGDARGKIVFHRPHPTPKIDPVAFRSMGRRMGRWFGWGRRAFVVVGKGK